MIRPPNILLVDDEKEILWMVERAIRRSYPDATIDLAHNAAEAETSLASRAYDIIVCDYRMPGTDGVTFLSAARVHSRSAARILLTAYPAREAVIRGINDAQLAHFLTKPISMNDLMAVIREAWEKKAAEDAAAVEFAKAFHAR